MASDLSPADRDWIIRTVAGEADPPGQAAVTSVIKNRLATGNWGNTAKDVVLAPGQFSMWNGLTGFAHGAGANQVGTNLSSNSPVYQNIGKTVDNVFSGDVPDPTKGALNYYNPSSASPGWGPGMKNAVKIGAHIYGTAGPARPVTPTPGTTLTSTPALASAPVSRETPAPTPALSPYQMLQQGNVQGALSALAANKKDPKTGEEQPGTSSLSKAASAFQPQQQPQIQSQPLLQPQDNSAAMIGPSQQLLAQILATSAKPLSWSSRPYGSGLAGQQVPGTTLNATGGLYG